MASLEFSRTSAATVPQGLRTDSRAEISLNVAAYLSGNLTPVILQRATSGGCRLESTVALTPGSIQQFRFTTRVGQVITLIVRIGSCRRPVLGTPTTWIVECVFAHAGTASVQSQIAKIIDDVTPDRRVA